MASGIFFNYWGVSHSLILELFDRPSVWRAVVDAGEPHEVEVFFDAPVAVDIVELINFAVDAWVADGQ